VLTLNAVSGTTLAANTAVVVENTTGSTVNRTYYGEPTGTENENSGSYLVGTYETTEVAANAGNYLLQMQNDYVAFYLVTKSGLKSGKNRAYLSLGTTGVKSFVLTAGDATAIQGINDAEEQGAIYDLSGRRLNRKPSKGIYIQNGKRYLVK